MTMTNKVIDGLKRLEEGLSRYGMPWRHEKDIVSDAIKCVELMLELLQALEDDEPCNIYEVYKKAKELIE